MAFDAALYDSIWEDHLELVQRYCPKGLEQASMDWMTPENIETLHSSLKEYNKYFTDFIIQLDAVVLSDDYATQDQLSEFLDIKMPGIISKWVADSPFLIFPTEAGKDDEFTQEQLSRLIKSLLQYLSEAPAPEAAPEVAPEAPAVKHVEPEPPILPSNSLLWKYLCNPITLPRIVEDLPPPRYEPPQQYQHYEPPPQYEPYLPPQGQPYEPPQQYYEPPQQYYEPPQQYYEPPQQYYEPPQEQPYEPPQEQPYEPPQEQHYEPPQEQPYEPPQEQPYEPPKQEPPKQEPPRQVARAMVYRRTMRKKHRLSRVKTCKTDRTL